MLRLWPMALALACNPIDRIEYDRGTAQLSVDGTPVHTSKRFELVDHRPGFTLTLEYGDVPTVHEALQVPCAGVETLTVVVDQSGATAATTHTPDAFDGEGWQVDWAVEAVLDDNAVIGEVGGTVAWGEACCGTCLEPLPTAPVELLLTWEVDRGSGAIVRQGS